jgi:FkbM family methyltransferase
MPSIPIRSALPTIEFPTVEIIDIGAGIEGEDRYAPLMSQGMARVTGFEPDDARHAELIAGRPPDGPYRYLKEFVGAGGPATVHITRWPGCTSLYRPDPTVIDLFDMIGASAGGNFEVLRTATIETRRLDDIADCPAGDYLKLDVQGAELDVLRGAGKSLASAVVIELEAEFVPLYENQPLFGDIQVFLAARGFMLHKLIDISGRAFRPWRWPSNPFIPLSQLLSADAIFVRDFTRIELWSDAQLLKAAAVLHDVYGSYDLVNRLLREYGRRCGVEQLWMDYSRAVSAAGVVAPYTPNIKQRP